MAPRPVPAYDRLMRSAERHPVCGGLTDPSRSRRKGGYLTAYVGNARHRRAHRIVWQHHYGPPPPGALVCHRCDQPDCYDPRHLFLGTQAANMQDKVEKGRQARGSRNGGSKLSEAQVLAILDDPRSDRAVGRAYGVSGTAVGFIRKGKKWRHLTGVRRGE